MLLSGEGPNSHDILMKNTRQSGLPRPRSVLAMHCSVGANGLCSGQPRTWCPLRQVEGRKRAMRMSDSILFSTNLRRLVGAAKALSAEPGAEQCLKEKLKGLLDDRFDYILIDYPSTLGILIEQVEKEHGGP